MPGDEKADDNKNIRKNIWLYYFYLLTLLQIFYNQNSHDYKHFNEPKSIGAVPPEGQE